MSLPTALDSTHLLSTNSIGLIAEQSAVVPQAQHKTPKTMNHVPASGNRKLLENTTIRLSMGHHICAPRDPARKRPVTKSTSLLASRLLLLSSRLLLLTPGLLVLLLLLLPRLLLLTGLTLGKVGIGLLFPPLP